MALRGLPIAGIKLDRTLVVNSVGSDADRIILGSVTHLAHELGLFVVAEGIETVEHHQSVLDAGCDLLQGYLFRRPVTAEVIDALRRDQQGLPPQATSSSPFAAIAGALPEGRR